MTTSSSAVTVIPQRFCGLRVLLVEPDKKSLQHHADVLKQNSYRVTTTTEASRGLSMITNGHTYDCVLIDADICESIVEAFLHHVLRSQPKMSIILMASVDIHLRIPREALESEVVFCILKPCSLIEICNIWKHICRNRISFDPGVKQSAINGSTVINNRMSSGNFTEHQAPDINSQEYDPIYKQVTYEDLFSNDDDQEDVDEITAKENIDIDTMKKADKGKQPFILKRKNDQPVDQDNIYPKKSKEIKMRVTWKGELHEKFKDALKELGEQAHSSAILKHMNVPGLTRYHVASHLQKYQQKQKLIEASIAALAQRGNNLQVENFANRIYHHSTQSDGTSIQSSNILRSSTLNLAGIFYMIIENIRAKLQEAPPLPVPQLTTTSINNYGGDRAKDHRFRPVENSNSGGQETEIQIIGHDYGNEMEPRVTGEIPSHHAFGEAMAPLGTGATVDANCLLSGLYNGNFGDASGGSLNEVYEQPWIAGSGGFAALLNHSQEDLALPDYFPCEAGGLGPSQVNRENMCPVSPHSSALFDVENCVNLGFNLDSIPFGWASVDFSITELPTEENERLAQIQLLVNSTVPLDGSEDRFIDNHGYLTQSDLENTMGLLNDDEGNFVN